VSTTTTTNGVSKASSKKPDYTRTHAETGVAARVWVGDCREVIPKIPECAKGSVDMIFADPPFNWKRNYDRDKSGAAWKDNLPDTDYCDIADSARPLGEARSFTMQWLDGCIQALAPHGSLWVNIPDTWAAEIAVHLKARGLAMVNWCVWHYRFGQNLRGKFINSKVHALYFCKDPDNRVWRPDEILEISDRRSIYYDARTENKRDGMPAGLRVPMDVWYGKYWGRIQGNNAERRHKHDNQLPEVYLERVIRCSSEPGALVMDPFLGSGTTGVVAHALGREFIGVEYARENAKRSMERIKAGPVRLGEGLGESTAIFQGRRKADREAGGALFNADAPADPGTS